MSFLRRHRELEPEPEPVPAATARPRGTRDPRVGADPQIDLNVPVSNPELVEAINRCVAGGGQAGDIEAMNIALARAVYLAPVTYSRPPEQREPGHVVFTDGTEIGFLQWRMSGDPAVTGFGAYISDDAYNRCAPPGTNKHVLKAGDVFFLALHDPDSAGLVLNPGDATSIPLYRPWCEDVRRLLGN